MRYTITTDGILWMSTYGRAIKTHKQKVLIAYGLLAVAVPVIIPLPLILVIKRYMPEMIRLS